MSVPSTPLHAATSEDFAFAQRAGFWRWLSALSIDALIVAIPFKVLASLLYLGSGGEPQ